MTIIIKWGLVFLLSTALATVALQDNGQVSMVWGQWIIETSVSFLIVILAISFITIYLLTSLWHAIILLPRHWRERRAIKRHNKAEQTLTKGLIALEYGDWKMAEKQLITSAKFSEVGLVHYLSAAKMAHNQQAFERRDKYLQQAKQLYIDSYETIGLVEARLLKDKNPKKSLAILQAIYQKNNTNRAVLEEYANLLQTNKYWQTLAEILPQIKKHSALAKLHIEAIDVELVSSQIAGAENVNQLDVIWQKLENKQQMDPKILTEFIEQKIGWGQENGMASLIIKSINKTWDDRLIYQYGRLKFDSPIDSLKVASKWLKNQKNNPILQLTLGRISCQGQLWAIAQSHFKTSLKLQPEVETYHSLAKCYEQEGLESKAALVYKQAILELGKKSNIK